MKRSKITAKTEADIPDSAPINPLDKHELDVAVLQSKAAYNQAKRLNKGFGDKFAALMAWFMAKLNDNIVMRILNYFTRANGSVISAGVAYYFFFSGIAAVSGLFAVSAIVLRDNPGILATLTNSVAEAAPGLLKTANHPEGLLNPEDLLSGSRGFSFAAILSLVLTLYTGLNVLKYLRLGIRAMFVMKPPTVNFVVEKLRDLLGFLILGLLIVISSLLSFLTGQLLETILNFFKVDPHYGGYLFKLLPLVITFLVDVLTIILAVKYVSMVKVPWKYALIGASIGAIAMMVLRQVGTAAVSGTITKYPALSAFAVPLILLLWFNIICQIFLYSAAAMKVLWADHDSKELRRWIRNPVKVARAVRRNDGSTPNPGPNDTSGPSAKIG